LWGHESPGQSIPIEASSSCVSVLSHNVLQDAFQHEPTSTAITVCIDNAHCGQCKIVIVAPLLTAVDNMVSYLLNFCGRFFCPKNICGMSRITSQHFFAVRGQLRKNLYIASNIGHADKSNSDILNMDGHAIIVVLILTSTHCFREMIVSSGYGLLGYIPIL
jgi:hypothetical protein